MSSYLSFYIVPKRKSDKEPKKHIILATYSGSSDIYQYFDENVHPVFIGNSDEVLYTTLTSENIRNVLSDFNEDIHKAQIRLTEYEKYAKDNLEYIEEILSIKKYIEDLQYWRGKISFIEDIIGDMDIYKEIEEICCNIS